MTQKNACSRFVLTEDKVLMELKTLVKNISARPLTLLIFAEGWALYGRPQLIVDHNPNTSQWCHCCHFLHSMFKPIKTLSSVRKHLQKVVCFILLIYSRAFHNNVIFNGKSDCCNDTFTDVRTVYVAASKEWLRSIQIILCC